MRSTGLGEHLVADLWGAEAAFHEAEVRQEEGAIFNVDANLGYEHDMQVLCPSSVLFVTHLRARIMHSIHLLPTY